MNNEKLKENKWKNNVLFMECMEVLEESTIIADKEIETLIKIIMENFEFYGSSHLKSKNR